MFKYILVVSAFLYCVPCVADDTGWFVTLGLNVYGKNDIHYDIANIISGRASMRDDNCGYNLSAGYDWEWIAAQMVFNRVRAGGVNAVAIMGRVTMPIFPLENLPYIGVEYGAVGARYSDNNIRVHDETTAYGMVMGVRYDITDCFFMNVLWQYNAFRMYVDVGDVPIKLNIRRKNIVASVGWRF